MADELSRRYGSEVAVDRLSFKVSEGEILGLIGPNGAGKTTTIRLLACLIPPSGGSATVAGYDIAHEQVKVRRSVGVLTENPALYERLTPKENLDFFGEAYGLTNTTERNRRIHELLEFFNLWDRRNDKIGGFSKGMKQKLAIARALLHDPPILLLDEPTSGLDPETASGIRKQMMALSRERKRTILLSTHRLEDADKMCSKILVLNKGRGLTVGSPEELKAKINGRPTIQIRLKNLDVKILDGLRQLEAVKEVTVQNQDQLILTLSDMDNDVPNVVRSIGQSGGMVLSVNNSQPTLEETYLRLIRGEQA